MHEDIDNYEPDMDSFDRMDPEEKRMRRALWGLTEKYYDGKISPEIYYNSLELDFFEILEVKDWEEIAAFKKRKEQEKAQQDAIKYNKAASRQKAQDDFFIKLVVVLLLAGLVFAILTIRK